MIFIWVGFVMAGGLTVPAKAELPPIYQSIREIQTILESEEIGQALGIEPGLTSIVKTKGGYKVGNGVCEVEIRVRYLPTLSEGPAKYKIQFGRPYCKGR